MIFIGPFAIGVLMLCDAMLLHRQNKDLAKKKLHFPFLYSMVWLVFAVMYMVFGPDPEQRLGASLLSGKADPSAYIAVVFFLFIFPMYLFRRRQFYLEDPLRPKEYLSGDDRSTRNYLGLEFFYTCMIAFYGSLFIELTLGVVYKVFRLNLPEIDELMISVMFSTVLVLIIIYRSARKFSPHGFWQNVGFAPNIPWSKGVFAPIISGMVFAGLASLTVMRNAGRQTQTPMSETLQTAQSPDVIVLFIAWAWMVAPFFEEVIFRGYYFHILRKSMGRVITICLVAMAFAVLHVPQYWGDWAAISAVAATGLGLTLLRDWSGTTRASLIMHLVYNVGVTMIPAMILTAQNPYYYQYTAQSGVLSVTEKEELLLKNIQYNPEYADAYNDLAWLYAENGINIAEGLRLIDSALQMIPTNTSYLDTKAELLEALERYEEALAIREEIRETSYSDDMVERQDERIEWLNEILVEDQNFSEN